jgi:hypothetical protein
MAASVGRPKLIPDIARVEMLAARGLTMEQIAYCLGVAPSTLYERKAEMSELAEAIKRGQSKGLAEITNALYENAKAGNLGAQIWYLKVRGRWTEPKEIDINATVTHENALKELE